MILTPSPAVYKTRNFLISLLNLIIDFKKLKPFFMSKYFIHLLFAQSVDIQNI